MPTYEFICKKCEVIEERDCRVKDLDKLKTIMYHCDNLMERYISCKVDFFERSPFPPEAFEHADYTPKKFRDKQEMKDWCQEIGLTSRLLEDGDVP